MGQVHQLVGAVHNALRRKLNILFCEGRVVFRRAAGVEKGQLRMGTPGLGPGGLWVRVYPLRSPACQFRGFPAEPLPHDILRLTAVC